MPAAAPRVEPFFLPAQDGQRFCLYYPPAGVCRGAVLYLHPFGDEMNKARRMAALAARALAANGIGVLAIDLHGCGDSSGEFGEARWDTWRDDAARASAWLSAKTGMPVALWGLRLGALLALDCARTAGAARVLLWQPITSGATFLTQFLRMKMASEMLAEGGDKAGTGTKALREQLRSGAMLEVGGYELAPAMADAIEALDAAKLAVTGCPVHWLEVGTGAARELSPAGARIAASWQQAGVDLRVTTVQGLPFWATQEIMECAALVEATAAQFDEVAA
jgi:exosortase A-associated hydrolase 2